jgi:hypothetical protein
MFERSTRRSADEVRKMKYREGLLLVLAAVVLLPAVLAAQVDTAWVRRYNGPGNSSDGAKALAADASGNVYVTGYSVGSGTDPDYATIKYDSAGTQQWVQRYDGSLHLDDVALALALDASANVYVTGMSCGHGGDYATIKYNSAGTQQWMQRYDGPGNGGDLADALAVDASGNVYVTGYSEGSGASEDSGTYFYFDYATIKYNSAGVQQWVQRYNGPVNGEDYATAIAVDASGNVYVTGYSAGSGTNWDYATIKYDSAGTQQWVQRYNGPGNDRDEAYALALDASGNVYVTGCSDVSGAYPDYATIKYDSAGTQQWVQRYNGPGNEEDVAFALALDASANVYVTGMSYGHGGNEDYATIKYNSAGTQQWMQRYNGPGNGGDGALALAVDASGNVYVTGYCDGSGTDGKYATIKYDSVGTQQWVQLYSGPGNDYYDEARALAVDASGNVYVTGCSDGAGTQQDYATIKYRPTASTDVGCTRILAPTGPQDSGTAVTPACSVYNYGGSTASFNVRMRIGASYNNTASVSGLAPGTRTYVTFPSWTASPVGMIAVRCSTELTGDAVNSNDKRSDSVIVRQPAVHDVGGTRIVVPAGPLDSGALVTPACSVYNYGAAAESYSVRMKIGSSYNQTASVSGHAPGTARYVTFPTWVASPRGSFAVGCSTELVSDAVPANDRASSAGFVEVRDLAAISIVCPKGQIPETTVVPCAVVRNNGTGRLPAGVEFWIIAAPGRSRLDSYYDSLALPSGLPTGRDTTLYFPLWVATPEAYWVECDVFEHGDMNPGNDRVAAALYVGSGEAGWVRKADVPIGPKSKRVKDGGALAYARSPGMSDTSSVYAFKGNNRCEFFRYNISANTWATMESIPAVGRAGKKKAVKKGAAITAAEDGIYAAKGNNCLEFWLYNPSYRSYSSYPWTQKADVPTGAKNVKEGAGAATVIANETTYVYFLKGSGTQEFYRYNPMPNLWETMSPAPLGASNKTWKNGSCLAYDGANTIYAVKGSYNEFFSYSCSTNAWTSLASLPMIGTGGKKKKVKDGAGLAYHAGHVYAQKGGNTYEFWTYAVDSHKWVQYPNVPLGGGKKVKGGGALCASEDALYEFKGNNTREFYSYTPSSGVWQYAPTGSGAMSSSSLVTRHSSLAVAPNPFAGTATISYSLPEAGNVSLKLYDVTGKLVRTLASGYHTAGSSSFIVPRSSLSSGIYILKLVTENSSTREKLIIE